MTLCKLYSEKNPCEYQYLGASPEGNKLIARITCPDRDDSVFRLWVCEKIRSAQGYHFDLLVDSEHYSLQAAKQALRLVGRLVPVAKLYREMPIAKQ